MIISTNILSEYSKEDFRYIVTPSAEAVSDEILNALGKRYRCLSLIGSYGTGKSSFLYALGKSILGEADYFPNLTSSSATVFKSVGQYESLLSQLGSVLKSKPNLDSIFHALKEVDSKGNRVYIFLDEFGRSQVVGDSGSACAIVGNNHTSCFWWSVRKVSNNGPGSTCTHHCIF